MLGLTVIAGFGISIILLFNGSALALYVSRSYVSFTLA